MHSSKKRGKKHSHEDEEAKKKNVIANLSLEELSALLEEKKKGVDNKREIKVESHSDSTSNSDIEGETKDDATPAKKHKIHVKVEETASSDESSSESGSSDDSHDVPTQSFSGGKISSSSSSSSSDDSSSDNDAAKQKEHETHSSSEDSSSGDGRNESVTAKSATSGTNKRAANRTGNSEKEDFSSDEDDKSSSIESGVHIGTQVKREDAGAENIASKQAGAEESSDEDEARPVEVSSQTIPLRFAVPPGFKDVAFKKCPIHLEDISKDDELWLIKVPNGFDMGHLKNTVGAIGSSVAVGGKTTEDAAGQFSMKMSAERDKTFSRNGLSVLLPSKKDKKLHYAGPFRGKVNIVKEVDVEPYVVPADHTVRGLPVPDGLKQRFQPFGADGPVPCCSTGTSLLDSSKKRKHRGSSDVNLKKKKEHCRLEKMSHIKDTQRSEKLRKKKKKEKIK